MSLIATCRRGAQITGLCGLLLALAIAAGCGPKPAPPSTTTTKPTNNAPLTNAVADAQTNLPNPYASFFEDLPPPKGRDPFFPTSARRTPPKAADATVATTTQIAPVDPGTNLVLRSILGVGKNRTAVINNAIFQADEVQKDQKIRVPEECHVPDHQAAIGKEPQVDVSANHLLARLIEIGADYVLIQVEGETQPRKLMMEHRPR